jgi:hypothetical protein
MESYRNRAAEFGTQSADEATTLPSMQGAYRQAVEAGFPSQFVAEQVFLAIWHEKLYIHSNDRVSRAGAPEGRGNSGPKKSCHPSGALACIWDPDPRLRRRATRFDLQVAHSFDSSKASYLRPRPSRDLDMRV